MAKGGRAGRARGGISIAGLRRWLLAGVIVLLVGVGSLIGFARWKAQKLFHDIPQRLGADIRSETNGYTYSQSVKGRTVFTVHAARAIQRSNGKTTLHDVSITLFGPAGSNRTDSIRGDAFEYDQPNGVVRAVGDVHLDLATPAQPGTTIRSEAKRIQVTTRGLIFLQKLGVAATDEPLTISYGDLHGGATGADYESDTGILRLRSDVKMDGAEGGTTFHVRAASADLDRTTRAATLQHGQIDTGKARASGDAVTLHAGAGGGVDRVDAVGNARLQDSGGKVVEGQRMQVLFAANGKPSQATMDGNVNVRADAVTGRAEAAKVSFQPDGQPATVEFLRAVHLSQRNQGSADDLAANRVVANLISAPHRPAQLRDAVATGQVELRSDTAATAARPAQHTTVRAETLHAVTSAAGSNRYISALTGASSTRLDTNDGVGNVRSSTGDTLEVTLESPGAKITNRNSTGAVAKAIQAGHVEITSTSPPAKGKSAVTTRGTAARAEFDRTTGRLILTGSPRVTSGGAQISADRIGMEQGSGDAEATGNVRALLPQGTAGSGDPSSDPLHAVADRMTLGRSGSLILLFGGTRTARLWTSTAQMDAPVIEADRTSGGLLAHGNAAGGTVHLALPPSATAAGRDPGGSFRVSGSTLQYFAAAAGVHPRIEVGGGVRLDRPGVLLTAKQATATLADGGRERGLLPGAGGSLQSIVATGDVRLEQPGRSAMGTRLLYTAADARYELTGTTASPPRVTDSQRGTVTGTSLVFHGADDAIDITGSGKDRVHTETEATRPAGRR